MACRNSRIGQNQKLMDQCSRLKEYSQFIDCIRQMQGHCDHIEDAVDLAIELCISQSRSAAEIARELSLSEKFVGEFLEQQPWKHTSAASACGCRKRKPRKSVTAGSGALAFRSYMSSGT